MKILLLSAYNTHSHNYWAKGLMKNFPEFDWTFLELSPRKFSWRIRGNPLSLYASQGDILKQQYDTVLATSMVDLATLIGLYPNLASAHKLVYFHENQFEYPQSENSGKPNVEAMMVNLYSAMVADTVLFNSEFNRHSFMRGAKDFLKRINDESPIFVVEDVDLKSQVLPVPIMEKNLGQNKKKSSILWNHRWEYDKNPEDFYKALRILKDREISFKLMILGIQFKNYPKVFDQIHNEFADEIIAWGYQEKERYLSYIKEAEFVVSTAVHEFQGLAVMDAVQHGTVPIVPDRLSYPQWFAPKYRYKNSAEALADKLELFMQDKVEAPCLEHLTWKSLNDIYKKILINR